MRRGLDEGGAGRGLPQLADINTHHIHSRKAIGVDVHFKHPIGLHHRKVGVQVAERDGATSLEGHALKRTARGCGIVAAVSERRRAVGAVKAAQRCRSGWAVSTNVVICTSTAEAELAANGSGSVVTVQGGKCKKGAGAGEGRVKADVQKGRGGGGKGRHGLTQSRIGTRRPICR